MKHNKKWYVAINCIKGGKSLKLIQYTGARTKAQNTLVAIKQQLEISNKVNINAINADLYIDHIWKDEYSKRTTKEIHGAEWVKCDSIVHELFYY